MKRLFGENFWLKVLALVLAVALYYTLKAPHSHLIPNHEGQDNFHRP